MMTEAATAASPLLENLAKVNHAVERLTADGVEISTVFCGLVHADITLEFTEFHRLFAGCTVTQHDEAGFWRRYGTSLHGVEIRTVERGDVCRENLVREVTL